MPVNLSQISAVQPVSTMTATAAKSFSPRTVRDVPKEFEAFVLQSFIQEMLPKNAEDVYGSGIAGDIWRSMLSEKLAFEIAERGDIGIADQVRSSRGLEGSGPAAATGGSSATVTETQASNPVAPETPADGGSADWRAIIERS